MRKTEKIFCDTCPLCLNSHEYTINDFQIGKKYIVVCPITNKTDVIYFYYELLSYDSK